MKNRKAVLGLDTAKLFVLAILVLVIISIVSLIVLEEIKDAAGSTTFGGVLTNSTTDGVLLANSTGVSPLGIPAPDSIDCLLTVTRMTNASSGDLILVGNYTVSGCIIQCTSDGCGEISFNNSLWNVTGSYLKSSDSSEINKNISGALSDFFEDSGTWFTLIGIVIIILIISIVIIVVNKFGDTGGSFSRSQQVANI